MCQELRCNPVKETVPQYQTVRSCSWPAKRHHDQFCTRRSGTDDDDDYDDNDDDDGDDDDKVDKNLSTDTFENTKIAKVG